MANISHFTQTVNGVSTTYDIHDANAIPLAGTNGITGTGFFKSTSDGQLQIGSGTSATTGGCFVGYGSEYSGTDLAGAFILRAARTAAAYNLLGKADGTLTWNGSLVFTSHMIEQIDDSWYMIIRGGTDYASAAYIMCYGINSPTRAGQVILGATSNKEMYLKPDGTWTWNGTACQITSDQRLKQQIAKIDDKLLDAWESVDLVQFKYNDAVDQKGDNARLHTGFVVQQIDSACKSHGVDISQYGLYCHEEYPEETEEVEVEQEDGTKVKERKVIREASEHYSLRYTEVYAVECKYLRRCIARLTARIEELEKENTTK